MCSIERLEYSFGEVLPCKNLQINVLETELTLEREYKFMYSMDQVL